MGEDRRGGTAAGRVTPDGQFFPKEQETERLDAGLVAALPLGSLTANLCASGVTQDRRHLMAT